MNFNNEVFKVNDHEFSAGYGKKKIWLYHWNREQKIVRPLITIEKGEILLHWSDERVTIDIKADADSVVVYDIPAFKTFQNLPGLAGPYSYRVGKRYLDTYGEFVKRFFIDILHVFDDIKTTF